MADDLRLKINREPTLWNQEMAIGFLGASVLSMFVPMAAPVATMLVAGVAGSLLGKYRMSREENQGRRIKEPTIFNRQALVSGLLGASVAQFFAFAATEILSVSLAAAAPLMLAATAVGLLVGGLSGGLHRKEEMGQERELALHRQFAMQSPVQAQTMEQAPVPDKSFVRQLEAERAAGRQISL